MNKDLLIKQLKAEGYKDVRVCPNGPNTDFPEHTHDDQTVHVILDGEVTLIDNDETVTLKKGERFEIPAGTTHRAKAGQEGCTFIVGFLPKK